MTDLYPHQPTSLISPVEVRHLSPEKPDRPKGGWFTALILALVLAAVIGAMSTSKDKTTSTPADVATFAAVAPPVETPVAVDVPPVDAPVPADPATPDASITDASFLATLAASDYASEYTDPSDGLIQLGKTICTSFDGGLTFMAVINTMTGVGYSDAAAAYFVGVSIGAYCLQYAGQVPGQ